MSTQGKLSSNTKPNEVSSKATKTKHSGSFFHRLDIRFPWLKLVTVISIGILAIIDLCDLTITRIAAPAVQISVAPMAQHVRATERFLEGKMLVALTFDDGPSAETTPLLLDILSQKDVPATFFILGYMARANPDLVRRIANEWHEVASHTMYHQNLTKLSDSAVKADISEANSIFESILNHPPSLTRPPYGSLNNTVRAVIGTPMILWSVDTLDWKNKDTASIISITMEQVHDGAIILMHDIHPTSIEAVPKLIDTLRDAGYEFATISELAEARGVELTPGAAYYNFRP